MTPGMFRGCTLLVATVGALTFQSSIRLGAQSPDAVSLVLDQGVDRNIDRGEEHRYAVRLNAGDYARVTIEQRGTDIVASVRGVAGQPIADFDEDIRNVGEERVDIVADVAGIHLIVIKAAPGTATAGAYGVRLTEIRRATAADRASQESRALGLNAATLETEGHFDAARGLLEQALAITEATGDGHDLRVANIAAQLAGVYRRLPDNARSESLFLRALSIMDASLGPDNPTTIVVRLRLGLLYQNSGQRPKAEALLQPSLDALEKAIGSENRWYVSGLMTLANLHNDAGDFTVEEDIDRRAMTILEHLDDTESSMYASLLNNLGEVYRQKREFPKAEELYLRALAMGTKVMGENAYFTTTALQNLGVVARERRDYQAAEAYYTRALSIREKIVGPDHPDVAQLLNNLAIVYRSEGDVARSLQTHLRALAIWERAAGPYRQATLLSVGNIARTYAAAGDLTNAVAYERRADELLEKQLALNLSVGSERQKLLFASGVSERTDRTISLHLLQAPDRPDAAALAALVLLQRKGRVLDAMANAIAMGRDDVADPTDRVLLEDLKTSTSQLARLALSAPDATKADERQKVIKDLETRKERLEAELSAHSAEFRARVQPVTLETVVQAIPDDAALIDFAIFRPFDPNADRNGDAYGPPHYAAYVLRSHHPPEGFDLGPTPAIDDAVEAFRQALRDPSRVDARERGRKLDEQIMKPLRGSLGNTGRLLVAPDGTLNLVPFEALVDQAGGYLIERYAISYLTSGRDLLRMQVARKAGGSPVIFADPLFGEPAKATAHRAAGIPPASHQDRGSVTSGEQLSSVYFAPLAATGEEARAIKTLFPEATLFMGSHAEKSALQHVNAPRLLHIASHGYFLEDRHGGAENPLLRSGLALAGANLSSDARDRGIMTALEASGLNLWGTQLVTLSACDTGVGEIKNGEGVYGLRRAFVLAGTETLVMSLWPVSDAIARETMVAYYTALRAGLGRGDALRQSKLAMLNRSGRHHPFYWASFIQSGDWTSLDVGS